MALTLNQVINRIKTLALSHRQIRSFYRGAPTDFDILGGAGDVTYPACFCEKLPGSTNRAERYHQYNFRLYFYDLINLSERAEENEQNVLSDMDGVALGLISIMSSYLYQDDWIIVDNSSEESEVYKLGDSVGGSVREIGIRVDFLSDACQEPSLLTFNDLDMAQTRLFKYTGTGNEGDTFTPLDDDTGVSLAGKLILAVYRAGEYKRVTTDSPVDTEHIRIIGSLSDNRKGVLSTTGVIELQSGDTLLNGQILDFLIRE